MQGVPDLLAIFKAQLPFVGFVFALIWGMFFLNCLVGKRLNVLGIYPRHLLGLPGIATSPFIHGDLAHLLFNSIPLFILMNFVLIQGRFLFYKVSIIIVLLTGIACWIFARKSFHIGASGVVMGYFSYLLVNAYHQPTLMSILLGGVCLYYFIGLFAQLFPKDKTVSWEAHVFGFLSGVVASYMVS